MIRTILAISPSIILEQILASVGLFAITIGFYPLYKESITVSIERATTKFENGVYTQDPSSNRSAYVTSVIESFLDLLNKIRRKKAHNGLVLTGGLATVIVFCAYLLQREVVVIDGFLDQSALVSDLFAVAIFCIFLEILLAIRLVLLIGSPYSFKSEELEEFIGRM